MKILDLLNENDDPVVTAQNQLALARKELQDHQTKVREMQGKEMQAKRAAVTAAQQALQLAQKNKQAQPQQQNTQQQTPPVAPQNTQQQNTQQQPNNQAMGSTPTQ